ncbi:MAG UNVERIFIED_CONTAM: hypothetical protein LOD86_10685 [Thermobifida fusca]
MSYFRNMEVRTKKVPCKGGPLRFVRLAPPFDKTIPLSSGRYRLVESEGGEAVYVFEPDARGRIPRGRDAQ